MSVRIEWGYAADVNAFWCARRQGVRARMLCGRRMSWMPPVPYPFTPPNVCPDCARILAGQQAEPVVDEQAEGTCPVCVGQAPLDEAGRIAGHNRWLWSGGRLTVTSEACAGAGEWPEDAA